MKETIHTDILKKTDTIVKADARHTFDTVATALGAEEHNPLVVVGTVEKMENEAYIDSVTYGYVADFMEEFVRIDMLLVSEFDYVVREADETVQRGLLRLFEGLVRNNRQVVFTMTQEPETYEALVLPALAELVSSGAFVVVK